MQAPGRLPNQVRIEIDLLGLDLVDDPHQLPRAVRDGDAVGLPLIPLLPVVVVEDRTAAKEILRGVHQDPPEHD